MVGLMNLHSLVHLRIKWTPGENGVLPQELLRGIKEAGCMGGTIGHSQKTIESSQKNGSVEVGIWELVTGHGNMMKGLYVK